jgi:hypothetical protein
MMTIFTSNNNNNNNNNDDDDENRHFYDFTQQENSEQLAVIDRIRSQKSFCNRTTWNWKVDSYSAQLF